jgi:hypothetical protein
MVGGIGVNVGGAAVGGMAVGEGGCCEHATTSSKKNRVLAGIVMNFGKCHFLFIAFSFVIDFER